VVWTLEGPLFTLSIAAFLVITLPVYLPRMVGSAFGLADLLVLNQVGIHLADSASSLGYRSDIGVRRSLMKRFSKHPMAVPPGLEG